MQISSEGKIGIVIGLLALAGAGAIMVFPDQLWIGWTMIAVAAIGFTWLGFHHFGIWRQRMIPAIGMVVFGIAFLACAAWYFWPSRAENQPTGVALQASPDQDKATRAAILSKLHNKYPERIIADVTPEYLMDLYKDHLTTEGDRAIAPFIGKWVMLSGQVYDVPDTNMVAIKDSRERLIFLYFDDQKIDRLSVLRPKQNISAFCQLKNASSLNARFKHCEFIDQESK